MKLIFIEEGCGRDVSRLFTNDWIIGFICFKTTDRICNRYYWGVNIVIIKGF